MKIKNDVSVISLIISNLIPIVGVIFWQWNITDIIFLYWIETLVMGVLNIPKIKKAQGLPENDQKKDIKINGVDINQFNKKGLIRFFLFTYIIFNIMHFILILVIFGLPSMTLYSILIASLSIFISHYISYKTNFIGKNEYLNISPARVALQPESRILIVTLVVMLGGFFTQKLFGGNFMALIILVTLKILVDLYSHTLEHDNRWFAGEMNSDMFHVKDTDLTVNNPN